MSQRYLRYAARAVALLGCLALTLSGEVGRGYLILAFAGAALGAGLDYFPAQQQWLRQAETAVVVALALVIGVDFSVLHLTLFITVAHFLILFQTFKLLGKKERKDCLQILMFGFFQILAACTLSVDVSEGLMLLLLVPLATIGFFWHQVEWERERSGVVLPAAAYASYRRATWLLGLGALPVNLFLTVAVFLFFPRLTMNVTIPGLGNNNFGYSRQIDLTQTGRLQSSTTPILWLQFPSDEERGRWNGYLRGDTLDVFDGRRWGPSANGAARILLSDANGSFRLGASNAGSLLHAAVTLVNPSGSTLFTPERPILLGAALTNVILNSDGSLHATTSFRKPIRYSVASELDSSAAAGGSEPAPNDDLRLPPADFKRTRELADEIAGAGTEYERAQHIESYLRAHYRYSLQMGDGTSDANPVDAFLFQRHEGPCGYFASAMATMLRLEGIPSRVVAGYLRGEWNAPAGQVLVRDSDAHAWVEAYLPGKGWQRYDPSPREVTGSAAHRLSLTRDLRQYWDYVELKWNQLVIDYDLYTQLRAFERFQNSSQPINDRFTRWRERHKARPGLAASEEEGSLPVWRIGLGAAFLLLVLGIFSIVIRSKRMLLSKHMDIRAYQQFLIQMTQQGVAKAPAETGWEYVTRLGAARPAQRSLAAGVTERYYRARFGRALLLVGVALSGLAGAPKNARAEDETTSIKTLTSRLKSGDPDQREHAAESLKNMGPAAERAIPALCNALNDDLPYVRIRSAEALAAIGAPAAPALIAALKNDSSDIRSIAVISLGKLGAQAPGAVPALVKTLKDSDLTVRSNASTALIRFGSEAIPGLIPLLKDESAGARTLAVRTLGQINSTDERLLNALMGSLADDNPEVSLSAVKALGHKGIPSVPILIEGLHSAERVVREQSCVVLADLGRKSKSAVPSLRELLKDSDAGVRGAAATALGKIGSAAQPALPELKKLTMDENSAVASRAREALTNISALFEQKNTAIPEGTLQLTDTSETSTPAAAAASKKKPLVSKKTRAAPAKTLTKPLMATTKIPHATALLIKQLNDIDDVVRLEASQKLTALGSQAVPALMNAIRQSTITVQMSATTILGQIGAPAAAAVPLLNQNLSSPQAALRQPSAVALLLIDSTTALGLLSDTLRQSSDPAVTLNVVSVLGRVGAPAAPCVPALVGILKDSDITLSNAASLSLSQIATPEALSAVKQYDRLVVTREIQDYIKALRAKAPNVDNKAVEGLVGVGTAGVPGMAAALHDSNVTVRIGVSRALNRLGREAAPATSSLIDALDDSDATVRKEASGALGKINTPEAQSALRFLPEKQWVNGVFQRFKK